VSAFGKAWGLAFGAAFGLLAVAPPAEIDQGGGGLQSHAKPAQSVKNKPKQDQALVEHAQAAIKDIADSGGDSALEVGRNLSAQLFSPGGLTNHVTETHQTQQATQERGSPGESAEPLTAARVDIPAVPATPAGSSGSAGSVGTIEPHSGRFAHIADDDPTTHQAFNQPLSRVDSAQAAIEVVANSGQSGIERGSFGVYPEQSNAGKLQSNANALALQLDKHHDDVLALILILAAIEAAA
jgi:hypothetical protein